MNNCLIDNGINEVIWNCRCLPNYWSPSDFYNNYESNDYYNAITKLPFCTGKGLYCANTRLKSLDTKKTSMVALVPFDINDIMENISKPASIQCLQNCKVQDNNNQLSFAPFPQKGTFFYQKSFCDVASHILTRFHDIEYIHQFWRIVSINF